jgi:hypothetical protein
VVGRSSATCGSSAGDADPWIGFTSYRQREKQFPFCFADRRHVEELLTNADLVCWGRCEFPQSLSQQAESFHPGINEYMGRLFGALGEPIPRLYHVLQEGAFPKLSWCLAHRHLPYATADPKWLSYVLERLFIIWYLTTGKRIVFAGGFCWPLERDGPSHASQQVTPR